jgi:hypothetical protein
LVRRLLFGNEPLCKCRGSVVVHDAVVSRISWRPCALEDRF